MLLPKFATHISPFKLSHFAHRGQQHFQNLRNTLTNLNLSSSNHLAGSSATSGLGSSASGSSAGGAGAGSKWSAGSRTNWNQQTHGYLINHTNPLSQEGLGSRLNEDDEEHDEFSNQSLSTIGLYNKRNRTISSRWNYEQDRPNTISSVAFDSPSLQIRCKSAFINLNQINLDSDTLVNRPNQTLLSSVDSPNPHLPNHLGPTAFVTRRPLRRHSLHHLASSASRVHDSTPRTRRLSTGTLGNPTTLPNSTQLNQSQHAVQSLQRYHSTVVPQQQTGADISELPTPLTNQTRVESTDSSRPLNNMRALQTQSNDEQCLQRAVNLLKLTDQNHYVTFYQLRKLLDSYVSSTSTPNHDVIDILFWGMIAHKPSFEPISHLLKCHQFLIKNTSFRPTPQTYSVLLSGLCKRDVSNAKELDHRKNRLANISVNQQLNQSLPHLSLAPISTNDDVRVIAQLSAEPNYSYAARLFHSLDRELVTQLQPSALEDLIRCCANVDLFGHTLSSTETAARVDLAFKAFSLLEDRQALTAESYSNLITLFGLTKNLTRAKSLFETYTQSRVNPNQEEQHPILYHQHVLQPPPSLLLAVSESLALKMCSAEPVNENSDAQVLLSFMQAHLANGDSISALGLLEESLSPTVDPLHSIKSSAAHVLEIILGFIRSNDYSSASKWIKRLFNGDHAMYQLDDPNRRREFMDRIVNLACEPNRGFDGLGVAYDAAIISIDQIDSQFDTKAMAALMARLRNVLNSSLVYALHQSACLDSSNLPVSPIVISRIQESLEKACSIVCYIISKRSALLKSDKGNFEAISHLQTYGMIENLAKRVIQSCESIKNRWISNPSKDLMDLGQFSENLLVRLMSHYSILPDTNDMQTASAEFRHQSSYLTGLLTSYQSLVQPIPGAVDELTSQQLKQNQFKFGLKITTPMILNNMTLVLAMQFYQIYTSGFGLGHSISSINDWIILLTVGSILEIQVKEGKFIPSIQKNPTSDRQVFLEPLLAQFSKALSHSNLQQDPLNPKFDIQLLLHVIKHYNLKISDDEHVKAFLFKLQETQRHDDQQAISRFEHYVKEGDKYLSNRFGLLRDEVVTSTETSPSALASPFNTPAEPAAVLPPNNPASSSQFATSPHIAPSSTSTSTDPTLALSHLPSSTSPVPYVPLQSFNEPLSQLALSMFCSKDLDELDKLYESVHQSTRHGRYLTADASSALIETFGRQRQLNRVREMYANAHVALASLGIATTNDQALRSVSWTRVEDRMIIGLAYCGMPEELLMHKKRLIDSGSAPSADAYAAMIQHAHETTDDASIALACFEEAIRNRVKPNTFLCNTIISKLSKARRSTEALEVFEYMKQSNLPRNSVTFGAIINACSKTGDYLKAEELFQEMLRSKNFKPRIPPFNTMIQLFTQNVKQPNRAKVLHYYDLMTKYDLPPSDHTYNLLMQAYGVIEPCDPAAMEQIFQRACNDRHVTINGSHWSTLLNVKGCVQKDLQGAINLFDQISVHTSNTRYRKIGEAESKLPDAICYEALFNVFLAFKRADLVPQYIERMHREGIHMTAYVVNTLMKVYSSSGNIQAARDLFESLVDPPPGHAARYNHPNSNAKDMTVPATKKVTTVNSNSMQTANIQQIISTHTVGKVGDPIYREPSCYETMIRIEFGLGHHQQVLSLIDRLNQRGYPNAILNRIKKTVNL